MLVELAAEETVASGLFADGVELAWPPVAVEIRLRPDWGNYLHVGGKTDFREVGCWRQYHVTLTRADSVVCTLVATNRDVTCVRQDSTKFDFSLDRVLEGPSELAARALDLYGNLGCHPGEPLVLLRSGEGRYCYWYLDCSGALRDLECDPSTEASKRRRAR